MRPLFERHLSMTVHTFRRANARPMLDTDPDNPRDLVAKLATRLLDARLNKIVGVSDTAFGAMIDANDRRVRDLVLRDTAAHVALEAAFAARVAEVIRAMDAGARE
mgnify:CR=1 FL=1